MPILSLYLFGCTKPEPPDPCDEAASRTPSVEVGTGWSFFHSIESGDELDVEHGWFAHFTWMAARTTGIVVAPGPIIDWTLEEKYGSQVVSVTSYGVLEGDHRLGEISGRKMELPVTPSGYNGYTPSGDYGWYTYPDADTPRDFRLLVELTDDCGTSVSDEVDVIAAF